MNLTHRTYAENVTNPECAPEVYNPASQHHNRISWFGPATTRSGYEAICRACGVTPHTDTEIREHGYALQYATYTESEWLAKDREERVLFKLDALRLAGIETGAPEPTATNDEPVVACDCGHRVERSLVMRASLGTSCPDCYDRLSD